ncbi:MAG: SH3 domain-containing protein [Treponema sp.]|nr:SH3 domain-containing protein [Treponema sp.]
MKRFNRIVNAVLASAFIFSMSACSNAIGRSVVLWTIPEREISDGTVVDVYLKSNIAKTYVIADPVTGEELEVPLWKLSDPASKSKANKLASLYREYNGMYACCLMDGLPIRAEPKNGAKQIYRLRKNEIIKVLYKGEGEAPTSGGKALEGDWMSVLTSNGVSGWFLRLNLHLFNMAPDGSYNIESVSGVASKSDDILESVLSSKWYPDYYANMIRNEQIRLEYMDPTYGFDTGAETGTISIKIPTLEIEAPFGGITKSQNRVYKFNDTQITMTVRNENTVVVRYVDDDGRPISNTFVTIEDDVDEIMTKEKERRDAVYTSLSKFGPTFSSTNYGTLSFTGGGNFTWTGYDELVPTVISPAAGTSGSVSVKYFLSKTQAEECDGLLTFAFNGSSEEASFFYRKESNGIRLSTCRVVLRPNTMTKLDDVDIITTSGDVVLFFHN